MQMPIRYDGHVFAQIDTAHLDPGTLDEQPGTRIRSARSAATRRSRRRTRWPRIDRESAGRCTRPPRARALGAGYLTDAALRSRHVAARFPRALPGRRRALSLRRRPGQFLGECVAAAGNEQRAVVLGDARPVDGRGLGRRAPRRRDVRASVDVGRTNLFAELGAGVLSGRNVERNAEVTLRTGFTVPVYERATMKVSTGRRQRMALRGEPALLHVRAGRPTARNATSLGVPIEWAGRHDALSWDLTVTGGISNSYEKDSLYYPMSSDQRAAQVAAGFVYGQLDARRVVLAGSTGSSSTA